MHLCVSINVYFSHLRPSPDAVLGRVRSDKESVSPLQGTVPLQEYVSPVQEGDLLQELFSGPHRVDETKDQDQETE